MLGPELIPFPSARIVLIVLITHRDGAGQTEWRVILDLSQLSPLGPVCSGLD